MALAPGIYADPSVVLWEWDGERWSNNEGGIWDYIDVPAAIPSNLKRMTISDEHLAYEALKDTECRCYTGGVVNTLTCGIHGDASSVLIRRLAVAVLSPTVSDLAATVPSDG